MRVRKIRLIFDIALYGCLSVMLAVIMGYFLYIDILKVNLKIKPDNLTSFCKTMDTYAPEIKLNGDPLINILIGEQYSESGAVAVDDCDQVEVETSGEVDINSVGKYTISYFAIDNSGNSARESRVVNVIPEYRGTIYLTFDDGPGAYTEKLLDILKKYNVKATFFVTNAGSDSDILREYNEGHAIGLHTASHNYSYIYQNMDNFFNDLNTVQKRVESITGQKTYLMRFPGGSSNTVSTRYDSGKRIMSSLTKEVQNRGFSYFDWNISSGDAEGAKTADEVYNNVVSKLGVGEYVILQHDIKSFSVDAVEKIIEYGISNGYIFDKLDQNSFSAHHSINN